jgi:RsiW-degrading membrane proteinase PrsW (M82 family)
MAELLTPSSIFIALIAGVFPALFWLWFWLKEDKLHPEPRSLIMLAFLTGMLATALAYPIENYIADWAKDNMITGDMFLLLSWAIIEEGLKYLGIYIVALKTQYFDEPIDAVIYFVTIALGFAALENAMFLLNPVGDGDPIATLLLGNYRFIGATVLHVAASSIIGIALAFSFYERKFEREFSAIVGLAGAIGLHTLFNFSIITSKGEHLYGIFLILWSFIIFVLFVCERIKRLAPRSHVAFPHTGVITISHH